MIFVQNLEPQGVRGKILRTKDLGPLGWSIMLSQSYVNLAVIIYEM